MSALLVWATGSSFLAFFSSVCKSHLMLYVNIQIKIFNNFANVSLICCLKPVMQNNTWKILLVLQTSHVWWTQVLPVQLLENESLKRFCAFPLTHLYTKSWNKHRLILITLVVGNSGAVLLQGNGTSTSITSSTCWKSSSWVYGKIFTKHWFIWTFWISCYVNEILEKITMGLWSWKYAVESDTGKYYMKIINKWLIFYCIKSHD